MNSVLLDVMKKTAPRMNKDVTDGAAKKILEIISRNVMNICVHIF